MSIAMKYSSDYLMHAIYIENQNNVLRFIPNPYRFRLSALMREPQSPLSGDCGKPCVKENKKNLFAQQRGAGVSQVALPGIPA